MKLSAVLLLVCVLGAYTVQAVTFSQVATHLPVFQDDEGGFVAGEQVPPSAHATASGLLMASLYGQSARVNVNQATVYLESLLNGDYGYGEDVGEPSSLLATHSVIRAYTYMGLAVPNSGNVVTYLRSLYDAATGLFSHNAESAGSVAGTALVFECLDLLGELDQPFVAEITGAISAQLEAGLDAEIGVFSFEGRTSLSIYDQYYATLLAGYVQYDLGGKEGATKVVRALVALQQTKAPQGQSVSKIGGFAPFYDQGASTTDATLKAVKLLTTLFKIQDLSAIGVDQAALIKYCKARKVNLVDGANAHLTLAYLGVHGDSLEADLSFSVLNGPALVDAITQGTQLKPRLSVSAFDVLDHAEMDVELVVSFPSEREDVHMQLEYSPAARAYVARQFLDTANELGEMTFAYRARSLVAGVGEVVLEDTVEMPVGYGIDVTAEAAYAGQDVEVGGVVGVDAEFAFTVALHNTTESEMTDGAFDLTFSVVDASETVIHTETLHGSGNTAALAFAFALTKANVPAGALNFVFEVSDLAGQVHSTSSVSYELLIQMVASEIAVKTEQSVKLGSSVSVEMVVASIPDLRTLHAWTAARTVDMKVGTGANALVVAGVPSQDGAGKVTYTFTYEVEPTLDMVGTNELAFRFWPAGASEPVALANYDSSAGELWDDATPLAITTTTKLEMTNVQDSPKTSAFTYGNIVSFAFDVVDAESGLAVSEGASAAQIALTLTHTDAHTGQVFVSTTEPAVAGEDEGSYAITWAINPNAIQGAGVLSVVAELASGDSVVLSKPNGEPVTYNVEIGGDIDFVPLSMGVHDATKSVFLVEFALECNDMTLEDAKLRAAVIKNGQEEVARVPVAVAQTGDAYQVSFALEDAAVNAADAFTLAFYRESDRTRATESAEFVARLAAKNEALGKSNANLPKVYQLTPLFEVPVPFSTPSDFALPIRTQAIVLFALGAAVWAARKKYLDILSVQ